MSIPSPPHVACSNLAQPRRCPNSQASAWLPSMMTGCAGRLHSPPRPGTEVKHPSPKRKVGEERGGNAAHDDGFVIAVEV